MCILFFGNGIIIYWLLCAFLLGKKKVKYNDHRLFLQAKPKKYTHLRKIVERLKQQ